MEKWKEECSISLYEAFRIYNIQLKYRDDLYTDAIKSMIIQLFILTENEFNTLCKEFKDNHTNIMRYIINKTP